MKGICGLIEKPCRSMALLMIILFASFAISQETAPPSGTAFTDNAKLVKIDRGGIVYSFTCDVDTNTSDTSLAFTPDGYIGEALTTYPITYGIKHSSTNGVSAMKVFVESSLDGAYWVRSDTLLGTSAVDSTETYQSGTIDNNNKKFPYWRLIFAGQVGNRSDNTVTCRLYFYRRDTVR